MRRARHQARFLNREMLALGALFLGSGGLALIYEAAWQREFTLLFGSSAPATAAVLAAYFAGLGLGSFLFGRFAMRTRHPLLAYGLLEAAVALGVLLVAPILSIYAGFYPRLYSRFADGTAFAVVKGALAFAAIAVPTVAMGGTLPVLARLFEGRRAHFGEFAGWLYFVNTAGAAGGVALFPLLLGELGMNQLVRWCAGLNLAIAFGAFLLARTSPLTGAEQNSASPRRQWTVSPWVGLAFLSGFVIFVLQVGWSKALAQVHENSINSFSIVVAIFIFALAAGAQLARVLLRRKFDPKRALGVAWTIGGLATVAAPFLFVGMTDLEYTVAEGSWIPRALIKPVLLCVFAPVIFLGAGLPLILQHMASNTRRAAGDLTGRVLAGNIAGAVAGALAAGFLFPGLLGLWRTLIAAGAMSLMAGSLLASRTGKRGAGLAIVAAFFGGAGMLAELPRTRVELDRGERLLAIEEGTHGIAAVVERAGSRRLKLNNHYVLGGTSATGDERMQAHIPLLLHGAPRKIIFLGYGTGITAGAGAFHPIDDALAVELVPEVADLAARFFQGDDLPARRAKTRVLIEDGRNFLRGATEQFDAIIGDLVVPWRPGEGALYTLEQFSIGRARLSSNGIYCAWLPMFQLNREDFESILRTFSSVFANVSVWRGDFAPHEPALALIGSASARLPSEIVPVRLREMKPDRFNPQLKHERAFWMHLVGVLTRNREQSFPSNELNTADKPMVELRRAKLQPFTGRALQGWEDEIRRNSAAEFATRLSEEALIGWAAGALMSEFTLLTVERRTREAAEMQQRLRDTLGDEAARSIFGQ